MRPIAKGHIYVLSATVLLFALSSMLILSISASTTQEEAIIVVSEAEESIAKAYDPVLDIEKLGANISDLLVRLNDAAASLSKAHMALENGDFEGAILFAETTLETENEVVNEAELLKAEAVNARVDRSFWLVMSSVLGVSIVLIASLLGYSYFKRRYYRQLQKIRPRAGQA